MPYRNKVCGDDIDNVVHVDTRVVQDDEYDDGESDSFKHIYYFILYCLIF